MMRGGKNLKQFIAHKSSSLLNQMQIVTSNKDKSLLEINSNKNQEMTRKPVISS